MKFINLFIALLFGLFAVTQGVLFFTDISNEGNISNILVHLGLCCAGVMFSGVMVRNFMQQKKAGNDIQIVSEDQFTKMRDKAKRMAVSVAICITILIPLMFLYSYYVKHDPLAACLPAAVLTLIIGYGYAAFMYYKCGVE
jgi:hypothetical protein